MTKDLCNPSIRFSDFHFILVHSFLCLFLNTWRETILCWKQGFEQGFEQGFWTKVLNKGFEQRRAFGPEGAQSTKGFCNPSTKYFSDFHFILVLFFLSLFLINKREMFFVENKGFWTRVWTKEGLRPRRGSMNKGLCNPWTKGFCTPINQILRFVLDKGSLLTNSSVWLMREKHT